MTFACRWIICEAYWRN